MLSVVHEPIGTREAANVRPRASAVPAIELQDVTKAFTSAGSNVQAVQSINLAVMDGEFFSILGPSGCGKSTTLRMIAGFEHPSSGTIRLHGEDVTGVGPHRRNVNMVFQSYALFPHLNVWDNIAFGLRRRRVPKHELNERVREIIATIELDGREQRMPRELSGGQQQRVALARALVNKPRALLLDEPLGALDLKLRQSMQLELKRIQREVGITFVFVTHDQSEALTMSDRIAVMNQGRLEQCAAPDTLYERPATPFVAQFIGTSNMISVPTSHLIDGHIEAQLGEDNVLQAPAYPGYRDGDPVVFTVRPEKIEASRERPTTRVHLRGIVEDIVYLGASSSYTIRTALSDDVVVFEKNGPGAQSYRKGEHVWLTWNVDSARTFTSGNN